MKRAQAIAANSDPFHLEAASADLAFNFSRKIVEWFKNNARELPWRQTCDPYAIWISESMLQQTQVVTVIPYFERFLKAFPTVFDLASAPIEKVLKLWEGLGYYRRARHLHAAAQMIVREWNGKFPETREQLLGIPGIGAYTAGAILAIALQQRAPALDGNLIRVYTRLFDLKAPVDQRATLKFLWRIAEAATPTVKSDLRPFTEGMMELGALICTPKNPKCFLCPVRKDCLAWRAEL